MQNYILLPLVAAVAYLAYQVVFRIITRIQNASKARQLGCELAPAYHVTGFLGLAYLKELQAADADQMFPDLLARRQHIMSEIHGRQVSTFSTYMLGQNQFFTSDPKNIQAILATQFADYDLGCVRSNIMAEVIGSGIFTQDGKPWEHSRAMLRPNFVRDQVSDLDMEERHVQNLMQVLPVKNDGWTDYTDIQTLFFRLTIDASTEFLFGESVLSQVVEAGQPSTDEASTRDEKSFSVNFDATQMTMAKKFRLGNLYWVYSPKEYKDQIKLVNDFVRHYVDSAISAPSENKTEEGRGGKEKYIFLKAIAQQTRDPVEIRAQLLNILLAGRDTTASLLSWVFHELLRHPEVFTKLRQTVIDTFGTYEDPKEITFATLKSCRYLQHTLDETLRLWPNVTTNGRRTNKPTTIPRGGGPNGLSPVFLPKNTQIEYSVHVMHRRKDLWGEDAEEFKPERFEGRRTGWEYLPFNGGPRICIGQQFALTEASYVIVRLLQRFDQVEAAPGQLEGVVKSDLGLSNRPAKKVTLRMREAK